MRAKLRRLILENRSVTRIAAAWKRSRIRMKLKNAVRQLALRFRSVINIQRVTRGWMGRVYVEWVRMDRAAPFIQRRWFYYKSRAKFQLKRLELEAPLLDLRNAEKRMMDDVSTMKVVDSDDSFWRLMWHGTTCVTNQRNEIAYRKALLHRFKSQPSRHKQYDSRSLLLEHRGAGDDLYADAHGPMDVEEDDERIDGEEDETCRIITDAKLKNFFQQALSKVVQKKDVTMIRMAQALHIFSLGSVKDLVQGREIMKIVRKEDKHCRAFAQHDARLAFLERWMSSAPRVLDLTTQFDLLHVHHMCALRDWHCYRRYDLAEIHFKKAVRLARSSERPDLYAAFQCTHNMAWKINVKRLFRSYRRFLGFQSARDIIETVGMITTSLLLESRARVSKKLMKIRVYQEGTSLLVDAAGIKRIKKKNSPTKKGVSPKKKKKKRKPEEVLTGDRWTTIVAGEELRKMFVELGRMADLRDMKVAAKVIINMLVLVDVPREFKKLDGKEDEKILGLRVASGLDVRYKTVHHQTTQGFQLALTFFMSDDRAMTIQAHRTLTNGDTSSYGLFLTLDDLRQLFRDYDYQLKTYRYSPSWRARAHELIKKIVQHFELEKTGEDPAIDQAPPIRLLTVVNGQEKDEYDVPSSYLSEEMMKKTNDVVVRLVIAKRYQRTVNAARGYVTIRCQCWWRGLMARRRVLHIRTVNAANVLVKYVRPWYIERQGRISLIQKLARGHIARCRMMVRLTPLDEELRIMIKYGMRIGLSYRDYLSALHRYFDAIRVLRVGNFHRRRGLHRSPGWDGSRNAVDRRL
jgi:hypothetical protein